MFIRGWLPFILNVVLGLCRLLKQGGKTDSADSVLGVRLAGRPPGCTLRQPVDQRGNCS